MVSDELFMWIALAYIIGALVMAAIIAHVFNVIAGGCFAVAAILLLVGIAVERGRNG
jgi:hypothetical protein